MNTIPPNNQPIDLLNPETTPKPEVGVAPTPETVMEGPETAKPEVQMPPQPENVPTLESPQPIVNSAPVTPEALTAENVPAVNNNEDRTSVVETETPNESELDKQYFKAATDVIETYEEKPFEQEEKAEYLKIGYLNDRFDKSIEKSTEEELH
jgi:hypothetical protein